MSMPLIRTAPSRLPRLLGACSHPQGVLSLHCRNTVRYLSTQPSAGTFTLLPTRGLLQINGKDSTKFLQGLITNQMLTIENGGGGFLAAFLSPKVQLRFLRCSIKIQEDRSNHMRFFFI